VEDEETLKGELGAGRGGGVCAPKHALFYVLQ